MDSKASNRHPKPRKRAQFPSNSMKDSNLTMSILPAEIIIEILSRLPVKTLLKFRSVSKSWLDLISSPEFINKHLSLSNKKEETHHMFMKGHNGTRWKFKECLISSIFCNFVMDPFDLDYFFKNFSKYIRFVGCCNGLIFLSDYSKSLILWNPTTRMHKILPDFRTRWMKNRSPRYGFGYDELHNDYKVVGVFVNDDRTNVIGVKIYSLKSNSWSCVVYSGDVLQLNTSGSNREMTLDRSVEALYANGKLHFDTVTNNVHEGRNIISFDLANEKWETMEKPTFGIGETALYVETLGSDLCVFSDYKRTHLSAWVMNEYGIQESWVKKFTIKYPSGLGLHPTFFMSNKGEIVAWFGSTPLIYNSKDDAYRSPCIISRDSFHGAGIYVESLVCPFSKEGRPKKLRSRQSSNK